MATKLFDIYNYIDSFAPYNTQCEWDNSGITVGSKNDSVNKIGFALDVTSEVIDEAIKYGCDLVFTHHPAIFRPIYEIDSTSAIHKAIKNNINLICAHTNLDNSETGVNFVLADLLGLNNTYKLKTESDASVCRLGDISPVNAKDFSEMISNILCTTVKYADAGNIIKKVAVCGGAGVEFLFEAKANGADALVTGEIKHHEYLAAKEIGISVFCAGHYETEYPVIDFVKKLIEKQFDIECVILKQSKPTEITGV